MGQETQQARTEAQEKPQGGSRREPPSGWRYYSPPSRRRLSTRRWQSQSKRAWSTIKRNAGLAGALAALVSAFLALLGVLYTQTVNTDIAQSGQQETQLQAYLSDMGELLVREDDPLQAGKYSDELGALATAKTLAILQRLDTERKSVVLLFLYKSGTLNKANPVVDLQGVDLGCVWLRGSDLSGADLSGADLRSTNFNQTSLSEADLSYANLTDATLDSLKGADLSFANLEGASMRHAYLDEANLKGAELSGADLSQANGLTQEQINQSIGDETTRLPSGITPPEARGSEGKWGKSARGPDSNQTTYTPLNNTCRPPT